MGKDFNKAIDTIDDFFHDSNKKILLIRGYDNDAKIRAAIVATNKSFEKCIFIVNVMKEASRFINDAFGREKILPRSVNSNETYDVGAMKMAVCSYATTSKNYFYGNENTCTVICPVQTVLNDRKRFKKFIEELNKIESKKILLITTNEWTIDSWEIENFVDETFFYSVENDNPDLMSNLRNNKAI